MVWIPDVEKSFDMFIRFDRIHERDRHTHTETHIDRQTPPRHRPRSHIITRQKASESSALWEGGVRYDELT